MKLTNSACHHAGVRRSGQKARFEITPANCEYLQKRIFLLPEGLRGSATSAAVQLSSRPEAGDRSQLSKFRRFVLLALGLHPDDDEADLAARIAATQSFERLARTELADRGAHAMKAAVAPDDDAFQVHAGEFAESIAPTHITTTIDSRNKRMVLEEAGLHRRRAVDESRLRELAGVPLLQQLRGLVAFNTSPLGQEAVVAVEAFTSEESDRIALVHMEQINGQPLRRTWEVVLPQFRDCPSSWLKRVVATGSQEFDLAVCDKRAVLAAIRETFYQRLYRPSLESGPRLRSILKESVECLARGRMMSVKV